MGRAQPPEESSQRRTQTRRAREVTAAVDAAARTLTPQSSEDELAAALATVTAEVAPPRTHDTGATALGDSESLVSLDGVEVTQGIQDLVHSVPLVAGRATIVRVYLSHDPGVDVRGELLVARSQNGPWTALTAQGMTGLLPAGKTQMPERRADLGGSLNFRLPPELTAAGSTFLRVGTVRGTDGAELSSVAGLTTRQVTFGRAVPLRMRLVRFRYRMQGSSVVHQPSATDETLMKSWLRRAYPIAELQLTTTTADGPAGPFEAFQINALLIAMRAADVLTGTDRRTHYYGMVADSGFFMRGLASDVPSVPRPGTVASGPAGPGTYGWDIDGSYGDWYGGHELGHTFGRAHAEFCGAGFGAPYPYANGQLSDADEAFAGLDVGDPALNLPMRALRGTVWHDVMTYCSNQWLSSFTYRGIYDRLVAEDGMGAGAGPSAEPASGDPAAHVIATVDLTGHTGAVIAVLPAAEAPPAGSDAADRAVSLRLVDESGAVLDEQVVALRRGVREEATDQVTGVVDAVVPVPAAAVRVELLLDGDVLDSHPLASGGGAVGPLQRDASAGAEGPDEPVRLRWSATAGADERYAVQLSHDGGASWATVAVGLTEPDVTIARVDAEGALARVLATGGAGITVLRTDTVGG